MSQSSFCDHFLRSINLKLDLAEADRITHFQPTRKSVQIIRAILGLATDRAFISTAAYGSGKSLAGLFSTLCVENRPETRPVLIRISEPLGHIDTEAATFISSRCQSGQQGLTLVLEGHSANLLGDLRQAARAGFDRVGKAIDARQLGSRRSLDGLLRLIATECQRQGLDRLAIVWDEFGRHLEGLISAGQAEELASLQQLAEIVSRLDVPATLTLLLHQHFFQYAGNLNQSARNEWKKIEGRFRAISYVDDSREMIQLIATFVQALRGEDLFKANLNNSVELARHHREAGFFAVFDSDRQLADTLQQAYPLDPAVLFALPRLAGRIAQNERTVFDFIRQVATQDQVHLSDLYDYFAPLMRTDTGFGGTYKHWIETESALVKAQSVLEEWILKAACLLGIGLSGQRAACSPKALAVAVTGWRPETLHSVRAGIDTLIERKLLLYRRHAEEVSVWHGADVDLRGRLEEEKQRAVGEFDLEQFLAREYPPPIWKPVRYNADFGIRRYFPGRYVDAVTLIQEDFDQPIWQISEEGDGIVLYALVRSQQDIQRLTRKARKMPQQPGCILAIPQSAPNVFETALELFCLLRMQQDPQLTGLDPLVEPELHQMASDARRHLDRLMQRICQPDTQGPVWYDSGHKLDADTVVAFREALSDIVTRRFPKTPVINSEAVVRSSLSRPMINARKKLLTGILERTGEAHLGISGTTPDASMYRTVLHYTGLYHQDEAGLWRWAAPTEVADANLREVWQILQRFFTEPGQAKSPKALIDQLTQPPYGIRSGLIPIFVAAAYKAFPSLQALYYGNQYLPDILPSTIEDLCARPQCYRLDVLPIDTGVRHYLERLVDMFGGDEMPPETDLIRAAYDALCLWRSRLPEIAWTSTRLSGPTKQFRIAIKRFQDPVGLLFEQLPKIAEHKIDAAGLIEQIGQWKTALEQAGSVYETEAIEIARRLLGKRSLGPKDMPLTSLAATWAGRVPEAVAEILGSGKAGACLRILRHPPSGDRELIRSLAFRLTGAAPDSWREATFRDFERNFEAALEKIEEAVIELGDTAAVQLLEDRLRQAYEHLQAIVGSEQARQLIEQLIEHEDNSYGDLGRGVG